MRAARVDERGSGSVVVVALSVVVVAVAALTVVLTAWVGCVEKAGAVADLAALSGSHARVRGDDACGAAAENAAVNGGRIVECEVQTSASGEFIIQVMAEVALRPRIAGAPEAVTATATAGAVHS